jgi:hypothetical protein
MRALKIFKKNSQGPNNEAIPIDWYKVLPALAFAGQSLTVDELSCLEVHSPAECA